MQIIDNMIIKLTSRFVGKDDFGNRYYISKFKDCYGKYRRSIIYFGDPEPSKISPMWHLWLHYGEDKVPTKSMIHKWQKERVPNFTGSKYAYHPSGYLGSRDRVSSDYEACDPNKIFNKREKK